jgi:hypothetical protein
MDMLMQSHIKIIVATLIHTKLYYFYFLTKSFFFTKASLRDRKKLSISIS